MTNLPEYREATSFCSTSGEEWSVRHPITSHGPVPSACSPSNWIAFIQLVGNLLPTLGNHGKPSLVNIGSREFRGGWSS